MAIDSKNSPLVVLGFDVGDPDSIEQWAHKGYLPTIASIMKRGCWGRTAGGELICEHGTGLSLFSGVSKGQHGYHYFRQLKAGTYELQRVSPYDQDILPFWSRLVEQNDKVLIIDAPECQLVPGLPGFQVANWAVHEPLGTASSQPSSLISEIQDSIGPRLQVDLDYDAPFSEELEIYQRLLVRAERKGQLCRNLLARDRFSLVVCVFYEAHTGSHQFWKYRPDAQKSEIVENGLTHAIRNIYQAIDRQMGLILADVPENTNVFICSLFGMQDQYPSTGLTEAFCDRLAYHVSKQSSKPSLKPSDLVRRVVPQRWRFALSQHLSSGAQERLLAGRLRDRTNWQATTAFAIPSLYTGFLRINLRGREPEGIVEPGPEEGALLDRIEADLNQLIDVESGEPAVEAVARASDLFGNPRSPSLPDLFIQWKPCSHFVRRVSHPKTELLQDKPSFAPGSEEKLCGFLAAAGPSIEQRGDIGDVSVLDLAPRFLSILGKSMREDTASPRT